MLKKWDTLDSPSLAGLDISYERKKPTQITGGGAAAGRDWIGGGGGLDAERGVVAAARNTLYVWVGGGGGLYYWTY